MSEPVISGPYITLEAGVLMEPTFVLQSPWTEEGKMSRPVVSSISEQLQLHCQW